MCKISEVNTFKVVLVFIFHLEVIKEIFSFLKINKFNLMCIHSVTFDL